MKEMGTSFPQQKEVRTYCLLLLFNMMNCKKKEKKRTLKYLLHRLKIIR